ncbi:MAG: hypothetical protein WC609_01345 [Candidatus Paceibacterota bacterium]|jgi:1,4-dihydroxy-2-naphthoate octaprenyltransferase
MKTFFNYLGQLRIYSLLDLIVLLIAVKATPSEFLGVLLLHIGFLAYLEFRHSHAYRRKVPWWSWVLLSLLGVYFYGHILYSLIFLVCSYLYTLKNKNHFEIFAPILRGFQYLFLLSGIVGFGNVITLIAFIVIFIRNLSADFRDITKDKKENLKTLPIILGFQNDIKYIHLFFMLATTVLWWTYTAIPFYYLCLILLIQISVYNLTPR